MILHTLILEIMEYTLKSCLKKKSFTFTLSIFSGFLIAFVLFTPADTYSFTINCAPDVDIEEFPICEYENLWNQSERFNELLVDELSNRANDINAEPENFSKTYTDSFEKINRENPGLYEEGEEIKNWISEQLAKKTQ